jgi:hypothetical protein
MQPETIERRILELVARRPGGTSVCPSEVARTLVRDEAAWRALMPEIRAAAARLAELGRIRVTQRGRPVCARSVRGPIRLSRPLDDPPEASV